jgi:hypothetical protein
MKSDRDRNGTAKSQPNIMALISSRSETPRLNSPVSKIVSLRTVNSPTNKVYRVGSIRSDRKELTPSRRTNTRIANEIISPATLPEVRKKFRTFVNEINQYQLKVGQTKEKVGSLLNTRTDFQLKSFDKYLAMNKKPLENPNKEYKVNFTTKNCMLTNSQIEFEKFKNPISKSSVDKISYIHFDNANATHKNGKSQRSFPICEIKPEKTDPINKNSLLNLNLKNSFRGDKIKGTIEKIRLSIMDSVKQKQIEICLSKAKNGRSGQLFKENSNQKLLSTVFYYHLKLDKKSSVIRILQINPALARMSDKYGKYPIHYSVSRSMYKMTKILIGFESPIDAKDKLNYSPLDYAYINNNLKMAKVK